MKQNAFCLSYILCIPVSVLGVAVALIIIVIVFIVVVRWRRRTKRRQQARASHDAKRDPKTDYPYEYDKLGKHKSNVDGSPNNMDAGVQNILGEERSPRPSPRPPPVPLRPASYTPSTHDSINTLNNYNNFDTARNYGSAGDELESMGTIRQPIEIPEFLQNVDIDKPVSSNPGSPAPVRSLPPPPPYEEPAAQAHYAENHNTNDKYKEGGSLEGNALVL